jgi:hypothetical protein
VIGDTHRTIGDTHRTAENCGSQGLLFLKFRDRFDPTRFANGKADPVASMPGVQ